MKKITPVLICLAAIHLYSCDNTFDYFKQQQVALTSIEVQFIPQSNNGTPWDEDSKPDVGYILLNDQSKVLLQSTEKIEGDLFDLPIVLNVDFQDLPLVNHNYTLLVVDFDENETYQVMGSVSFNPDKVKEDLPGKILRASADLKVVLSLHWGGK